MRQCTIQVSYIHHCINKADITSGAATLMSRIRDKRGAGFTTLLAQTGSFMATLDWSLLTQIGVFFAKAGAFVFGSGLAIVPFLYGGVVTEHHWLNEKQFVDAVAVAMITPGPVVITVGFIDYLVAGFPGACMAALATFLPCYLFTIIPAPYFKKYGKLPAIVAFVDGVTAAAVGAITGSVIVIAKRSIVDLPTAVMALLTISVSELANQLERRKPFRLLDVRRAQALAASGVQIADAQWKDPALCLDWEDDIAHDLPIVVYCAHGHEISQGLTANCKQWKLTLVTWRTEFPHGRHKVKLSRRFNRKGEHHEVDHPRASQD